MDASLLRVSAVSRSLPPRTRRIDKPATRAELECSPLFRDFDLASAEHLFADCRVLALSPGETLVEPGEKSTAVYVLLSGRMRVDLEPDDDDPICELEPGSIAGELSLLSGGPRTARVTATEPSRVLELSGSVFWSLICSSHEVSVNLLEILATRVRGSTGTIAQGRKLTQLYKRHASVDALTGLHNRRWLDEVLAREYRRSTRDSRPLSFLMIDLDLFKRINDMHGHLVGDEVLRILASRLRNTMAARGIASRFGGEEFAVLLPDASLEDALALAERFRLNVHDNPIATSLGPVPATVSKKLAW